MQRYEDKPQEKSVRIFSGKNGAYQEVGMFPQNHGSVPKVKEEVLHLRKDGQQKEKIAFIEKWEPSSGDVVKEKICLDFYDVLESNLVAKSRIALHKEDHIRNLLFMFFLDREKNSALAQDLTNIFLQNTQAYGSPDDKRYATFMGKIVNGYSDLGEEFISYICKHHRPPEKVTKGDKEYPLVGLMKIAAIAKILGDPDWLGGSGANTGFVIEDGSAKAILVDAGASLSELLRVKAGSKNIQIGQQFPDDIHFDALTKEQKDEFIGTLYKFIHCANLRNVVEFVVKREGAFNSQVDVFGNPIVLLDEQSANRMIEQIMQNIKTLENTYQQELKEYQVAPHQPALTPVTNANIATPSLSGGTAEHADQSHDNSAWWPMLSTVGAGMLVFGASLIQGAGAAGGVVMNCPSEMPCTWSV